MIYRQSGNNDLNGGLVLVSTIDRVTRLPRLTTNTIVTGCVFNNTERGIDIGNSIGAGVQLGTSDGAPNFFINNNVGVHARGGGVYGVAVTNSYFGVDLDDVLAPNNHSIYANSTGSIISNCSVLGSFHTGIATNAEAIVVEDCTVRNTRGFAGTTPTGISIESDSTGTQVRRTLVADGVAGVLIKGTGSVVESCTVRGNTRYGVQITSLNTTVRLSSITGNGEANINVISARNTRIANSTLANSGRNGIFVDDDSTNITIEFCVVGGNAFHGIDGGGAALTVQSSYLGVRSDGTTPHPNAFAGVNVRSSAVGARIVSSDAATMRMVVSGNAGTAGMVVYATDVYIYGVIVGLSADGASPVPNSGIGLLLLQQAERAVLGDASRPLWNVFSGNVRSGVDIYAADVLVVRSLCGISVNGSRAVGNGFNGITIRDSAANVTVGGGSVAGRVVCSANGNAGVSVDGENAVIRSAYCGTDVTGLIPLGVQQHGIVITAAAGDVGGGGTVVRSVAPGAIVASGNTNTGIRVSAANVVVDGLFIGVGSDQTTPVPNEGYGLRATLPSGNVRVILSVVSNNFLAGIRVEAADVHISDSFVGVTPMGAAGFAPAANRYNGISVAYDADDLTTGENCTIVNTTVGANGGVCRAEHAFLGQCGAGISAHARSINVTGCGIGMVQHGTALQPTNLGNNHAGIASGYRDGVAFGFATNANIADNLVGFNGQGGIISFTPGATITNNVVGVPQGAPPNGGQNCSNFGEGIWHGLGSASVSSNRVAYSKFIGIRADFMDRAAVAAANIIDSTNEWGFVACELCTCSGATPNIIVNCNGLNLGMGFPTDLPMGTAAFTLRGSAAESVNWDELVAVASTLRRLDLSGNPLLESIPPMCRGRRCSFRDFPVLEELSLDETDISRLESDTLQPLRETLSSLSLVAPDVGSVGSASGQGVNLRGFAALEAIPWYNTSWCPQGFYPTKLTPDPHQLCFRCPSNTYGLRPGGTSIAVCEACARGMFDYDDDPVTPCERARFRLVDSITDGASLLGGIKDKYEIRQTHLITGPMDANGRPTPIRQLFAGFTSVNDVIYVLRVSDFADADKAQVFTDNKVGNATFLPEEEGNLTLKLVARDLSAAEALIAEWTFEVLPKDSDVPAYGPNGQACAHGEAVDTVEFDQNFKCDCNQSGFSGPNCEVRLEASVAAPSDGASTFVAIGVAVFAVLALILVFAVMRYKLYVARNKPVDTAEIQRQILEKYGIDAITFEDKHCGVVVYFEDTLQGIPQAAIKKQMQQQLSKRFSDIGYMVHFISVRLHGETGKAVLIEFNSMVKEDDPDALAKIAQELNEEGLSITSHEGPLTSTRAIVPVEKKELREISKNNIMRLEMIGKGAFAEVYRGLLTEPKRGTPSYLVAMKLLTDNGATARQDLIEEAALQGTFDHRNIVSIIGIVTIPIDMPAILLMSYCEHGSLLSYLAESDAGADATIADLLTFCSDVAKGMVYLQQMRFVHRDIAARNVLVDSAVHCKIADFGMSMALQDESDKEYVRVAERAAIRWCSPEALADQKFSSASDVWAYGVLVHEIFTYGAQPYEEVGSTNHVIEYVTSGKILPRDESVPEQVYNTIMLPCFQQNAADRPTMLEILDDLRQLGGSDTAHKHDGRSRNSSASSSRSSKVSKSQSISVVSAFNPSLSIAEEPDLSMDGVSVYHLTEVLMKKTESRLAKAMGEEWAPAVAADATIWHMVQAHVIPSTEKKKCKYVESLKGADHRGHATALLSYCWAYKITDVVRALASWCTEEKRDPKRTYIWMCALCVNQHEASAEVRSTDFFKREFGERVKSIGLILPLLLPWDEPIYLTRAWCLFELYTAISFRGDCEISAIFTPEQAVLFKKAVSSGGYSKIDETLNSIRSERARATVQDDEDSIKLVIKESLAGGFQSLDNMIRAHLLEWFHSAGAVQVASRLSRAPQAWSNSGNSRSVSRSQSKSRSIEASSVSREPADVDSKTLPKPYESNRVRPDRSGPRGASSLSKEPEIAEVVATPEDIFGVDKSNIGSKVTLKSGATGTIRFVGLHKQSGKPRVGVELTQPTGKHSGTVDGVQYFQCRHRHGVLVVPSKILTIGEPGNEYLKVTTEEEFGF
eukprot:m.1615215 g.1615215  ORF g.1615215 m.1615215 type:complete len:2119 (-) comp25371_c2_seq7:1818-8174(-)